ncbi:MAG: hypothetical protein A2096_04740 [Spirochaetes bacterium GWF1_41_5]|nr:MAG: hypothetical protein A2096_04740 [Spirochaetes bacterium GWF1_41_5]
MRMIYIDIDTLRPDHLGCYGYHRNTSPAIDRVARDGILFRQCFVPDAPCLPSRSALHHGRFGIHNGAVSHGGTWADPYPEGPTRQFHNSEGYQKFTQVLKKKGFYNCLVSSFAGRHDAWWFCAGFHEIYDCGKGGGETQNEVTGQALALIDRLSSKDNWYLHFNIWDPHTPYRTPEEYGFPFAGEPAPAWMNQEIIDRHNNTFGQHCAANNLRENGKFTQREPMRIGNMADYKKHIDGYDTGIRYADEAVAQILERLEQYGLYKDTAVIISSDHGENQGELNIYGDHQTADYITNRVPMIVKWPGIKAGEDSAFHYQFDVTATILGLLDAEIPSRWDAKSFKDAVVLGKEQGRDFLVVSNSAWSSMRAVIFEDYILIRTYRDPVRDYPEIMLFNYKTDPHEVEDLAKKMPTKVNQGLALLQKWVDDQILSSDRKEDPFMRVIEEGGPFHVRGRLENTVKHYENLGRKDIVEKIINRYPKKSGYWKSDWFK